MVLSFTPYSCITHILLLLYNCPLINLHTPYIYDIFILKFPKHILLILSCIHHIITLILFINILKLTKNYLTTIQTSLVTIIQLSFTR